MKRSPLSSLVNGSNEVGNNNQPPKRKVSSPTPKETSTVATEPVEEVGDVKTRADLARKFVNKAYDGDSLKVLLEVIDKSHLNVILQADTPYLDRLAKAFNMLYRGRHEACLKRVFPKKAKAYKNLDRAMTQMFIKEPLAACKCIRKLEALMTWVCAIGGDSEELFTMFLLSYSEGETAGFFGAGLSKYGGILLAKLGKELLITEGPKFIIRPEVLRLEMGGGETSVGVDKYKNKVEVDSSFTEIIDRDQLAAVTLKELGAATSDIVFARRNIAPRDFLGMLQTYTIKHADGTTTTKRVTVRIPEETYDTSSTSFKEWPFSFLTTKATKACYQDALKHITNKLDIHGGDTED